MDIKAAKDRWERLSFFGENYALSEPVSEMAGKLENIFRCKKASWQVDLKSGPRKLIFRLVVMAMRFLQENTEN
jgi:hypothetical protein